MEMKNLYILDSDKTTIGVLSNRMPFSLPFYDDLQTSDLDDFTDTLTMKIPSNHGEAAKIVAGNFILYPSLEGGNKLYKIIEAKESTSGGQNIKEIYCEVSAQDDLIKDVVRPTKFISSTVEQVAAHILTGTPFEVGSVENLGVQDVEINDYPTKLEALISTVKQFGGEFQFEYVTTGTTITAQRVNISKQVGSVTGKPFMRGKDLVGVERIEDRSSLVTALIGVGKTSESGTPLTFKDAQGVTQGIPEGYKIIGDYVTSIVAQENYSTNNLPIFGVYKDDQATSPQELFENTLKALQGNDRPKMTYSTSVVLLERVAGYEHERVSLGDTILVQDKTVQPELYLQARVRKLSRSLTNPTKDAVEFGDYIPVVPPINTRINEIQNRISEKELTWDNAKEIPSMKDEISKLPTRDELFSSQAQRMKVRYLRDYINGSDVNNSNEWSEIQVFKEGNNIAKGIVPTGSSTLTNPEYLTDGKADSTLSVKAGSGLQYVQLDLGELVENIEYIKVWHNFDGGRTYNSHFVDVSEDGVQWVRLFNSTKHGSHKETATGFIVPVNSSAIISTQEKQVTQVVTAFEDLDNFKQSVEVKLDQKVPLTTFNNAVTTINSSITDKADLVYVSGELKNKANTTEVYSKTEVDNAVNSRVATTKYNTDETGRVQRFQSAESRIKQVEDEITLSLSGTSYDKLSSMLKDNNTKITATAEAVQSAVSATEVKDIARRTGADVVKARYVRLLLNGNSVNVTNHVVELRVMQSGVNLAKGITPTFSITPTNPIVMTDDIFNTTSPFTTIGTRSQWVQLDLGQVYDNIDYLHVYMYWLDSRQYNYEAQVSEDSVNWISLYDYKVNGLYNCTDQGFIILVNEQKSLNSMNSSIKQTADSISTKVEKNGVISAINQSPESITLSAKKINFDGAVLGSSATFSGMVKGAVIETNKVVDNKINNARFDGAEFRFIRYKAGVTNPDTSKVDTSQIESFAKIYQDGIGFTDGKVAMGIGLGNIVNDGTLNLMADKIVISIAQNLVVNNAVQMWKGLEVWGDIKSDSISSAMSALKVKNTLDMQNNDITNINHLTFNDPGSAEGIEWLNGSGWKIVEAPYNMANSKGDLQFAINSTPKLSIEAGTGSVWSTGSFHGRSTGNTYYTSEGTTIVRSDASNTGSGIFVGTDGSARIWSMDVYDRTYSNAANMYITSAGTFGRSTSASKYKMEIKEVDTDDLAPKILELNPKSWFDKNATEMYAEYLTAQNKGEKINLDVIDLPYLERHYGLIAEDLVEAGLGMYVIWGEPDNETGERQVEGIEYDRLWTMLIPLVKEQRNQINSLEDRMSKLEAGI
ncbi:phage tail spike protein [Bacillus sp. NPDC077027]|uniref:phage tail spike protein n=1 Tax=Bacillus sp. NPDC077027 TaxID=3390548 RepID=UPI003D03B68D